MAQSYRRSMGSPSWEESGLAAVEAGVLQAVAYSDIFDYPLTGQEIHRYLVGVRASWREIQAALASESIRRQLSCRSGFFLMRGRDDIVETRRLRAQVAARMWPRAKRYSVAISKLPFVRMVAVTGALAMDNVDPDTDIDYLVVTEPGRLWLCRALVVGLGKLAGRRGDVICPNFFLSESALEMGTPNLFTAHELAQMVPMAGIEIFRRMRELNSWAVHYLPNAFDMPRRVVAETEEMGLKAALYGAWNEDPDARPLLRSAAEGVLRTPLGGSLERWEMGRKMRKLSLQSERVECEQSPAAEINLSPERCKGHFDNHQQRTLEAYTQRLRRLAVGFPEIAEASWALGGA